MLTPSTGPLYLLSVAYFKLIVPYYFNRHLTLIRVLPRNLLIFFIIVSLLNDTSINAKYIL